MDAVDYLDMSFSLEKGQGRSWLLTQKGGLLPSSALSRLDLRMLERHTIPRVLAVDVEEINDEAKLRYRLPVGMPLKNRFQSGDADAGLLLEVMLTIATTLADSRIYLLDERKYVLHPSLIMIGEGPMDVRMAYLPLRHLAEKPSLRHELYQLTLQLMEWGGIPSQDCRLVIECLKSSLFELGDFKQLLIEVLQSSIRNPTVPEDSEERLLQPPKPKSNEYEGPAFFQPPADAEQAPSPSIQDDGDTMRFLPGQWKLSAAAALRIALLLTVLVWAVAVIFPMPVLFGAAAAVTAGGLAFYFFCKNKEEGAPHTGEDDSAGWEPTMPEPYNFPFTVPERTEEEPSANRSFAWTEERNRLYRENPALTVLLEDEGSREQGLPPTELLVPETELLAPLAVLELLDNDTVTASLELSRSRFSFGRSPGETDCVLNAPGISRIHGELRREGDIWVLQDLGSKNGTRLNGEPLVSHQSYPLKNGDRITAAQTQFIFRIL